MKKKLIEMGCKGNVFRSTTAELVGKNCIQEAGASADYGVISSGILVKRIQQADYSPKKLKEFVKTCAKIGYQDSSISSLDRALRERDSEAIKLAQKNFIHYLIQKETRERNKLIKEFEIKGIVKKTRDQTIARPDVIAVLPMDKEIYNQVLSIYNGSGYTPLISVLSVLATGNLENQISLDNVPLNQKNIKDAYRRMIEQVVEETPQAVRKIIGA